MTSRKDSLAKPYKRSALTQIKEYQFTETTDNTDIPTTSREGFDVSDYLAVLLSVHPVDPDIENITAGADVTLRIWRYKEAAHDGTGDNGTGQWFCENDWTIPLDGDGSAGVMEKVFNIWNSERMYIQVISATDPGGDNFEFKIGAYVLGPEYADADAGFFEIVSASASAAAGGTSDVNLIQIAGTAVDADAGAASAGTLRVILASDSPGLGAHDVATAVAGVRQLVVATNIDPADVANQDDVHPIATLDGRIIVAGYDRLGDLVRIQETDPINFHMAWDLIEESSMGTAGSPYTYYLDLDSYYRMSCQTAITLGSADAGGVVITFHGTVEDDDPDLTARTYIDLTTKWTGGATVTTNDLIPDLNGFWGNCTAVKINVAVTNASDDSAIRLDLKRFIGG